ncbi:MAG: L-rhamnose mutarotase [Spirochaetia bacterium]|jgi:L-rhamnose mutarotase
MRRIGRVLRLRERKIEEYERFHSNVWPEVQAAITASGIRNYSIFRYERWLFSYFELPDNKDLENVAVELMRNPGCQRWEALMKELQEPLPESGETSYWVTIKEVWHHIS